MSTMQDVYTKMLEEGAPPLPPHMFYRVRFNSDRDLEVQIRERRKHFGSRFLGRARITLRGNAYPTIATLASAARSAYSTLERDLQAAPLLGDHGPTEETTE